MCVCGSDNVFAKHNSRMRYSVWLHRSLPRNILLYLCHACCCNCVIGVMFIQEALCEPKALLHYLFVGIKFT